MANPDFAGRENTLEALREFLQNMKKTVEHLYTGHILAARQTLKQEELDNAQSSYDFGTLSTPSVQPTQNVLHDGVGKPGQVHNWFFSHASRPSQGASKHVGAGKANLNAGSSKMDGRNALSIFLEDIKKTIELWSNRYRLLIEGKTSRQEVEALPQPLDSNNQVIDQLNFGPGADHDFSVMEVLGLPHTEALRGSAQSWNGKLQRVQGSQKRKGRKVQFQGTQSKADAASFSVQGFNEVMGSQISLHDQDSRPQSLVGSQECAESDRLSNHRQMGIEQSGYNSADHGKLGIDEVARNDRQVGENTVALRTEKIGSKAGQRKRKSKKKAPATSVKSQELTIRRFQYKVEVVESPDWLPKGWITELKTRSTGGSAGSKDKYYFDPVSNRRCRSQKEVFSLLETGKLGRYKRKIKTQPVKRSGGAEILKTCDIAETSSSNKQELIAERSTGLPQHVAQESTDGIMSTPMAAISPGAGHMGVPNNMFVPYRPGQPADWLVYESLANIPRPVLENLCSADLNTTKPNGERGSTSWPWFLNNSESSMKPFVDRFEVGKPAVIREREEMLGNGHFSMRESHFAELAAAKRARKPSKRVAVSS
ncbi:hypothetical protein L7F22_055266 [Adiantum nelumboides]|nr:hypothetical protein [Adiantum nelumboides]